jgi:uncharacterized membrane protein YqaE (UPF0057 family)
MVVRKRITGLGGAHLMLYVIALFFPPLALLLAGKVFQAIFNFFLMITIIGWFFAIIWAILVVSNHYADRRVDRLIRATQQGQAAMGAAAVGAKPRHRPGADPSIEFVEAWSDADRETDDEERERVERRAQARARLKAEFASVGRRLGGGFGEAVRVVAAVPGLIGRAILDSYRNLPEWAQPIIWGLLATSPLLGGFVVYLIWYR